MRPIAHRHWRLVVVLVLATVALGVARGVFSRGDAVLRPGALPADHAGWSEDQQCVDCHTPHNVGIGERVRTWFARSSMTPRCASCHAFAGPARAAHNRHAADADASKSAPIDCVACHHEHEGPVAQITRAGPGQCNPCHAAVVTSFARDHPPFGATFPDRDRTTIIYDHLTHATDYFAQAKFRKKAPRDCTTCHSLSSTPRQAVTTRAFAEACARCHEHQITGKDLVLFRFPLMKGPVTTDAARLRGACGDSAAAKRRPKRGDTGFASIGDGELTPITAYLLGVDAADVDAYQARVSELLLGLAEEGVEPLATLVDERGGEGRAKRLLAGLHRDVVRPAACAWIGNEEYTAGGSPLNGGWYTDALELRYKAMTPDDPVMKAWIELGLGASTQRADDPGGADVERMLSDLLSESQGAGRCAKCHAVRTTGSDEGESRLGLAWSYRAPAERRHTFFDHDAHARLSPQDRACETCHVLDAEPEREARRGSAARPAFVSGFKPIEKDTCVACHETEAPDAAHERGNECARCHRYHVEPTLRRSMLAPEEAEQKRREPTP